MKYNSKEVFAIKNEDIVKIRDYFFIKNKMVILGIINIGLNTALRYSDLSNLKFEDIKNKRLLLKEKKTNKRREIFLNETCLTTIEVLKKFYKKKGIYFYQQGFIFKCMNRFHVLNNIDTNLTIQSFNRYMKQASKDLGITYNIASHSLRKTWGKEYYEKYKDIGIIMYILNHSSENTTLRYIGINSEKIRDIFANFEL